MAASALRCSGQTYDNLVLRFCCQPLAYDGKCLSPSQVPVIASTESQSWQVRQSSRARTYRVRPVTRVAAGVMAPATAPPPPAASASPRPSAALRPTSPTWPPRRSAPAPAPCSRAATPWPPSQRRSASAPQVSEASTWVARARGTRCRQQELVQDRPESLTYNNLDSPVSFAVPFTVLATLKAEPTKKKGAFAMGDFLCC